MTRRSKPSQYDDYVRQKLPSVRVGDARFVYLSLATERETPRLDELTPAEREVALLASAGASNAEIAKARRSAVRTVANQIASIFKKLGVGSRVELAILLESRARGRDR